MLGDDEVFEVLIWISQHLFFLELKGTKCVGIYHISGWVYMGG